MRHVLIGVAVSLEEALGQAEKKLLEKVHDILDLNESVKVVDIFQKQAEVARDAAIGREILLLRNGMRLWERVRS